MDRNENKKGEVAGTTNPTATFSFDNNLNSITSNQNVQTRVKSVNSTTSDSHAWSGWTTAASASSTSPSSFSPASFTSTTPSSIAPAVTTSNNVNSTSDELSQKINLMHNMYMQREAEFQKKATVTLSELITKIDSAINDKSNEITNKIAEIDLAIKNKSERTIAEIQEKQKESLKELNQSIKDSETKLQDVRNSVLSTLALFASFFTFISISFSIFSKSTATESITLIIVLWSCVFTFIYTFSVFLHGRKFVYSMIVPPLITLSLAVAAIIWLDNSKIKDKESTSMKIENASNSDVSKENNLAKPDNKQLDDKKKQ